MEIRKEFAFLWTSKVPNKVIVAARGSGKTVAVIQNTVQRLLEGQPNDSAAFFSGTIGQAVGTVAPAMRIILREYPEGFCYYNASKFKYVFKIAPHDYREIHLFSYENQDSKRGFHPVIVILDECASMPYNMYGLVIDPMLSDERGILTAIGTPHGHDKFYELFQRGLDPEYTDWESYKIVATQCQSFTPEFLAEKRKNLTSYEYAQEYNCDFDANVLVGSVYGEFFNRFTNENIKDTFGWEPSDPVYTAWDLGFTDYTSIWFFQVKNDVVTFIDFFEDNGHDTSYYADVLNKRPYFYGTVFLPFDGVRGDMRGDPIKTQLEKFGFRCIGLERKSESEGIDEARRLLKTCRFNSVNCKTGIDHLKNFKYKIDKRTLEKRAETEHDEHSHASAAFRYAAMSKKYWKTTTSSRIIIRPSQDYNYFAE